MVTLISEKKRNPVKEILAKRPTGIGKYRIFFQIQLDSS